MISYIKGKTGYIGKDFIVIDNNGIGYRIFVSGTTIAKISRDKEITIYTYMNVKEDNISLFGFLNMEELNMFNMLITVSGVGPKGALSLLSALPPDKIALAVITGDIKTLSIGQGIGKKIAQRIALELKDKMRGENAIAAEIHEYGGIADENVSDSEKADALEALIMLGFGRSEAVSAAAAVYEEGMKAETIISLALKKLS